MTPEQANEKLLEAAKSGSISDATAALANGADPTAWDARLRTPLHYAAMDGNADFARLLIEKGADPTARDVWQYTPLHYAVQKGHSDLVTMLHGAVKNAADHAARLAQRRGSNEPQVGG